MKKAIKQSTLTFILNSASILLIALSIAAFFLIVRSDQAVDRANRDRYDIVYNARRFMEASSRLTDEARAYAATGDSVHRDNYRREAEELQNREMGVANMRWIGLTEKEAALVEQMAVLSTGLISLDKKAIELVEAGDMNGAIQAVYGPSYVNRDVLIKKTQDALIHEIDIRTEDEVSALVAVSGRWIYVTVACLSITALIQIASATAVWIKVIRPIIAIRDEMLRIAKGDLKGEFAVQPDTSEIGMLIGSIRSTKEELNRYIGNISDKLAAIAAGDLKTRVNIEYIGDFSRIKEAINEIASILWEQHERDRHSREKLEEAYEAAQAANKAKSAFLSSMSHEIRTPINAITGMTNIARMAEDVAKKDYCLEKIADASTHLLGVINDVLDMSKIDANKFELSPAEFDFEKMLVKVVNIINFRVEEKRQKLTVKIDKNTPRWVVADEQRLAQVLTNLLSNAVKFTPEGGLIRVEARLDKEDAAGYKLFISVKDSGIGISPEQQKNLFTSFTQADAGIARKFGGTGLGLAISKSIVEKMDGKIWIDSQEGQGATFSFVARAGRGSGKPTRITNVKFEDMRVLVVDDDRDLLEYFLDIAQRLGFSCDVAADGYAARDMIEAAGGYDMYFVDWKLPGMDGVELVSGIRERGDGNSAVIMISSTEWDVIKDKAQSAGVDRFLPKPLFPSMIADTIAECLGGVCRMPDEKEEEPDFTGYSILLAEDVDINREIVIALLEPTGMKITLAENGRAAVAVMAEHANDFDMIFMDVHMPEMDGYEATRRIRAMDSLHAKEIPIVAMTANVFKEDVEACLAAGMNDHVGKPLDFSEVVAQLHKYLPERKKEVN